jgi:alpha-N-arabinofuranosidase
MFQVKYWALGNETWGPWQVEQMTKEAYAHKALQWAKGEYPPVIAMYSIPYTIQIY